MITLPQLRRARGQTWRFISLHPNANPIGGFLHPSKQSWSHFLASLQTTTYGAMGKTVRPQYSDIRNNATDYVL